MPPLAVGSKGEGAMDDSVMAEAAAMAALAASMAPGTQQVAAVKGAAAAAAMASGRPVEPLKRVGSGDLRQVL